MTAPSRRGALAAIAVGLAAPALAASSGAGSDPLARRFGGPFALTTHEGRRVTEADFHGRFLLVFFGFTRCPDVCPTSLATMTSALELLGAAGERVQPVFVTVDPARDTPQALAAYVASFHPRLIGLTGSEAEIATVARAFRVHRVKYAPANGGDYAVDHGSLTYLMGPDGGFLTLIPHGASAERMAQVLARHLGA
jgi:protein SCO1/2